MGRKIKTIVSTGFAGCEHVDYEELPEYWDDLSEKEQEEYLQEAAQYALCNAIESDAFVVDEED